MHEKWEPLSLLSCACNPSTQWLVYMHLQLGWRNALVSVAACCNSVIGCIRQFWETSLTMAHADAFTHCESSIMCTCVIKLTQFRDYKIMATMGTYIIKSH